MIQSMGVPSKFFFGDLYRENVMNEKDWERFFEYLSRIVNDTDLGKTWEERKDVVQEAAFGDEKRESDLEEFTSWFNQ